MLIMTNTSQSKLPQIGGASEQQLVKKEASSLLEDKKLLGDVENQDGELAPIVVENPG